jgi:uncharacterized protein involved in type VI secretion and phage assembly
MSGLSNISDLVTTEEAQESKARGVKGVAVGIVTKNNDPEGLGRVKLHFQWLSEENETDWTRIATLMAGADRGSFFLPDVEDEVLVAFEHGDINRPIVIGALWSNEDKAPVVNSDGLNNVKKIRTRSGHEIIFDDTSQKERIEISTKARHKIVIDDTSGSSKILVQDATEQNSIEIDSITGSISISSASNIRLKSASIDIEGLAAVNIKAPIINNKATATMTSQAPTIINQAGANMSCISTGPLILKGLPLAMG